MKNLSKIVIILISTICAAIVLLGASAIQVSIGTNYIPLNALASIGAFVLIYNFLVKKKDNIDA